MSSTLWASPVPLRAVHSDRILKHVLKHALGTLRRPASNRHRLWAPVLQGAKVSPEGPNERLLLKLLSVLTLGHFQGDVSVSVSVSELWSSSGTSPPSWASSAAEHKSAPRGPKWTTFAKANCCLFSVRFQGCLRVLREVSEVLGHSDILRLERSSL